MGRGAGFPIAFSAQAAQLRVEGGSVLLLGLQSCTNLHQRAVEGHYLPTLGREVVTALWADPAAREDEGALGTREHLLICRGSGLVCWLLHQGALTIQGPVPLIVGESMPMHATGMIEHQAVGFAFGWAQTSAYHLQVEHQRFGGPGKHHTGELRQIESITGELAVCKNLRLPSPESLEGRVPHLLRRIGIYVLRGNATA